MIEAIRKAVAALTDLNESYGQGYGVAGYHLNGDLEPFDSFLESAEAADAMVELNQAGEQLEGFMRELRLAVVGVDDPTLSLEQLLAAAQLQRLASPKHETQATITAWARSTFGDALLNKQIAERALEELEELLELLEDDDSDPQAVEEVADVVIVLCQLPERMGFDLQEAVDRKMSTNRSRRWATRGDGTGQHV